MSWYDDDDEQQRKEEEQKQQEKKEKEEEQKQQEEEEERKRQKRIEKSLAYHNAARKREAEELKQKILEDEAKKEKERRKEKERLQQKKLQQEEDDKKKREKEKNDDEVRQIIAKQRENSNQEKPSDKTKPTNRPVINSPQPASLPHSPVITKSSEKEPFFNECTFKTLYRVPMEVAGYIPPIVTAFESKSVEKHYQVFSDMCQSMDMKLYAPITFLLALGWVASKMYCSYTTLKNNILKDKHTYSNSEKMKIAGLNTLQFLAFLGASTYILSTMDQVYSSAPEITSTVSLPMDNATLKIAAAGLIYQIVAGYLKKQKLNIREG